MQMTVSHRSRLARTPRFSRFRVFHFERLQFASLQLLAFLLPRCRHAESPRIVRHNLLARRRGVRL